MYLFILGMYQMLKCAMEKTERIETKLQLPSDKMPHSSEALCDVSNSCPPTPSKVHDGHNETSQEKLQGSFMKNERNDIEKHDDLISPEEVIKKYKGLIVPSKLPKLTVKLAREAFFGETVLKKCTV